MSRWDFKALLGRLAGTGAAAEEVAELGGPQAWARLMADTGYAGQPQALLARLADDLHRGLPLHLDRGARAAFAGQFDAPAKVAAARQEAEFDYPGGRARPLPASQISLKREEINYLWPWLSGQVFLRLCRAHFLTGDGDLVHAALNGLVQTCQANPPFMGPGWTHPALMASRAVNWLWGLRFLGQISGLEPERLAPALVQLSMIAQALAQSLGEGAAEPDPDQVPLAAALIHLGRSLACYPGAEAWLKAGAAALGPALMAWSRPGPNRPTAALAAACEWGGLGLWAGAGAGAGVELPGVVAGLGRLAGACRTLAPPWGAGAYWGWETGAPVLGLDPRPESLFTGPANLAAMLLNEPELRAKREYDERLFWLYGTAGKERLRQLAGAPEPEPLESAGAGLVHLVGRIRQRRLGLTLRTAPGPAALDLLVSLDGQGLLLPPGPSGTRDLARHLAQRAAHNALRVDLGEPTGEIVTLEALESAADHLFVAASFDGYQGLDDPVSIRRRVYADLKRGIVDVVDQVQAQAEHLIELFFRLPPGTTLDTMEGGILVLNGPAGRALLRPEPKARVSLLLGRTEPALGWRSIEPGQVEPAPVVRVQVLLRGSARLTTSLVLPQAGQ